MNLLKKNDLDEKAGPCECDCGEVYCSTQCKHEAYELYHRTLCPGKNTNHPYVRLREHAEKFGGDLALFMCKLVAIMHQKPNIIEHVSHLCYSKPHKTHFLSVNEQLQYNLMKELFDIHSKPLSIHFFKI